MGVIGLDRNRLSVPYDTYPYKPGIRSDLRVTVIRIQLNVIGPRNKGYCVDVYPVTVISLLPKGKIHPPIFCLATHTNQRNSRFVPYR
jgi:hypothetical protein